MDLQARVHGGRSDFTGEGTTVVVEEKHRRRSVELHLWKKKKRRGGTEVSGKPRLSERRRRKFMLFAVSVSWSIVHYCPRPSSRGANTPFETIICSYYYTALSAVHLSEEQRGGGGGGERGEDGSTLSAPATWPRVTSRSAFFHFGSIRWPRSPFRTIIVDTS